jgi:hypothetical protein
MVVARIAWGMDLVNATAVNATKGKVRYALAQRAGMHHVITEASDVNRLCVLGEVPSDRL